MGKTIWKVIGMFVLGVVGGIFADQILWPYFIERPLFYQYRLEQAPINITQKQDIYIHENVALENSAEKIEKAVVGIKSEADGKIIEGSGVIATADGLIVTINRIIPSGAVTKIYVNGKKIDFKVIKRDAKNDLVLIKIEQANLATVSFAEFGSLRFGQRVFLMGTIFDGNNVSKIVNEGVIKTYDESAILTNMRESKDIIGSPVFNIAGELAGLVKIGSGGEVSAVSIKKISDFVGF